jgi:hypothetical protein
MLTKYVDSAFSNWKIMAQEYEENLKAAKTTITSFDSTSSNDAELLKLAKLNQVNHVLRNFNDLYSLVAMVFKHAIAMIARVTAMVNKDHLPVFHHYRRPIETAITRVRLYDPDSSIRRATEREEFLDVYEEWKTEMLKTIAVSLGWSSTISTTIVVPKTKTQPKTQAQPTKKKQKIASSDSKFSSLKTTNSSSSNLKTIKTKTIECNVDESNAESVLFATIIRDYALDLSTPVPDYIEARAIQLLNQLDEDTIDSLAQLTWFPYYELLERWCRMEWCLFQCQELKADMAHCYADAMTTIKWTPYYKKHRKPPRAFQSLRPEYKYQRHIMKAVYLNAIQQNPRANFSSMALDFSGHMILLGLYHSHLLAPIMHFTFSSDATSLNVDSARWTSSTFSASGHTILTSSSAAAAAVVKSRKRKSSVSSEDDNSLSSSAFRSTRHLSNAELKYCLTDGGVNGRMTRLVSELRYQSRVKRLSLPFSLRSSLAIPFCADVVLHDSLTTQTYHDLQDNLNRCMRDFQNLQQSTPDKPKSRETFLKSIQSKLTMLSET